MKIIKVDWRYRFYAWIYSVFGGVFLEGSLEYFTKHSDHIHSIGGSDVVLEHIPIAMTLATIDILLNMIIDHTSHKYPKSAHILHHHPYIYILSKKLILWPLELYIHHYILHGGYAPIYASIACILGEELARYIYYRYHIRRCNNCHSL